MVKIFKGMALVTLFLITFIGMASSAPEEVGSDLEVIGTLNSPQVSEGLTLVEPVSTFDPTKYTLGSDDVVDITVMRHPEFSGQYPVNMEGKIQYKFVGDIDVNGFTKKELEE